jgi:hypothetical protein
MKELRVDVDTHRTLSARGNRLPPQPPSRNTTDLPVKYALTPPNSPLSQQRESPQQELPEQELPHPRKRWVSCCLETDRQAVVYFGQLFFSFSVLAFCCIQLYTADGDCNRSSPYIGLISFLLGKLLSAVTDSSHS